MEAVLGLFILIGGLALYFAPLIVAMRNERENTTAIGLLNLFLGWTLIGWVGALVWASTTAPKAKEAA